MVARQAGKGAPAGPRRAALRVLLAGLATAASMAPAVPARAAAPRRLNAANWDQAAQRLVVREGLMSEPGAGFSGAQRLSGAELSQSLQALATSEGVAPQASAAGATVSVVRFDAAVVAQLGLGEVAAQVERSARSAGLEPPSYFGTEVVTRFLELRYEHPVGEQSLDLYPTDPITRAEAAYSLAAVLGLDEGELAVAREQLMRFTLPRYDEAQLTVLRIAVSKIGMPYVWGGTTDGREDGLEHGGYDCSGFAWRVYKGSGLGWGTKIVGRTAAEQAGEIPKRQRIPLTGVQGGDLLFFGSAHFNSTATESNVIHEGIALSDEWAIHSSGQGVYVLPLTSGWLARSFVWARRVL
ncbi:MAG TPA: NlpC/P60 family protein [Solirubrobacteraceae bacterium]|nr:NlpC/P60 family protein [Solirubrobacteraceae bacterium]